MRRLTFAIFAVLSLAFTMSGCSVPNVVSPPEEVAKAAYRHPGPTRLTLFTMLNNRTGAGAHTSLMVNGSQRVIFDPAGSFKHDSVPERNDVLFGANPEMVDVYTRYHARKTYHVRIQQLDVSPQLAQQAMALVQGYGPAPAGYCANSTSTILSQLFPGQVSHTWYPKKLADQFGQIKGVRQQLLHEYDSDDNSKVLAAWNPAKAN